MSRLPLPIDSAATIQAGRNGVNNLGLLLDRYVAWGHDWQLGGEAKRALFEEVSSRATSPEIARLAQAQAARWQARLEALPHGRAFELRPEWRLIVGLGGASVLETGMTLHRIYGLPLIPGSAIKGMTRAYAELVLLAAKDTTAEEIRAIFGPEPEGFLAVEAQERPLWEAHAADASAERAKKLFWAGEVCFLDAIPLSPVRLEVDVMNPHYGEWYLKKHLVPGDYLSPVPVAFLTVARQTRFRFGVTARQRVAGKQGRWSPEQLVATAARWVQEALTTVGVGAKTAAGYGFFEE